MASYGERIGTDAIRFERVLPGPIERVWAWLTEAEKRGQWLAAGEMELRKGGRVELIFNNESLSTPDDKPPEKYAKYAGEVRYVGEVLEVDPPRSISFTWPEEGGGVSIATFELEPSGEQVRLTLTHKKLKDNDAIFGAMGGWHTHLDIMEAQLRDVGPPSFWKTHTAFEAAYRQRRQEG